MELTNYDTYENKLLAIAAQLKYGKKDEALENEANQKGKGTNEIDSAYQPFATDDTFDKSKFANPSKDEIVKLLGRKFRRRLTSLKPFVDIIKRKTSANFVSICPLSCTSNLWISLYHHQKGVSKLLTTAQKIGLLYCADSKYRFNARHEELNYCKTYAYNKDVEHKLLELFKEYDIRWMTDTGYGAYIRTIAERFEKPSARRSEAYRKYEECMSKSRIRISQHTRLPLGQDYLIYGLTKVYPQLFEMFDAIEKDNETMECSDWDRTIPTFSYNKKKECYRIGLRKTNQYCNLKVHNISWETLSEAEKKRTRNEVIRRKFGSVNENDVKSSIYRITYLLNHGVWLERSYDLYPMMAGFDLTDDERDLYKAPLAMKLYFSPSVSKAISSSEYRHETTAMLFEKLGAFGIFTEARQRMFDVIGPSYRSEIFLHESCIYTQVAHKIRGMGYKLIQIYDGFFTDKVLDESVFDEIVKECALEYYDKWNGYWYKWNTNNEREITDEIDIEDNS